MPLPSFIKKLLVLTFVSMIAISCPLLARVPPPRPHPREQQPTPPPGHLEPDALAPLPHPQDDRTELRPIPRTDPSSPKEKGYYQKKKLDVDKAPPQKSK
ncbi:MAG: hypothetical protein COZ46_03070 [Verrucomicrobia bacterium CG_4_10_14_3_um_filter_43_23]|nr:MAG: hypothetical protein AUJ82_00495 [Verrucomicrobia bacterium CG1_02_43_26]PIP59247.1 MAG: hypothetical protein COX01_04440 [Verrucomicrobia bacterium CG22_combo_CG10-13_8_21_14_all_43_17]PIX58569.1 MAG: hypothetical protein COZ46_03070 [Verrucomicrobia bacterium CG_4_10_14_3_um_filter_43_23]PIY61021.1 MAG: hypothetical protein COY94_07390 [Verrucomicrobia bacterium CG_4_10_14_0_8_um_filter_43_34]PJA43862.1 MAG: hypothetical protein CO175_05760 [Verrucomicrobia bacterium CG_4_9_14_3_um_fi